jgi:selenocysteine lyase/cysteine desulfurase
LADDDGFSGGIEPWSVEFRREMPVAGRWAYLDHAAVSPIPASARSALSDWASEASADGATSWARWSQEVEEVRLLAAGLIGAVPEEIALVRNTTEGVNLVAEGLPWQRGDNVVTLADEFPTNQYPWLNLSARGVETRRVPTVGGRVDLDQLAQACDSRTRIVTISWVSYCTGWRNDLDRLVDLAHRRGALLFVDAIQALGVVPLDVRQTPVDFLAADGHKWLLGPEGAGIFYLRREHLERLRPLGLGWNSVQRASEFDRIELALKPTAARYEGGSQNMAGFLALRASLKLLARFGTEAICRRILEITDLACGRLEAAGASVRSDRSPEHKSGIVVFDRPGRDPKAVRETCLAQGVVISCRGGGLRISPHAYNDATDIDRLIEVLAG